MSISTKKFAPPSPRTRVRRIASQANYDPAILYGIIDEAYLCHIAFSSDTGAHCIPTACWRVQDHLYIHGSNGSRMIKQLLNGEDASICITHLDGIVFARSAFNHAMNYRSAIIYGQFEQVTKEADKRAALDAFMDKIAFGRNAEVRLGSKKEMGATSVLRISLAEAATKIRAGAPTDDAEDMSLDVWAGVLPLQLVKLAPIADAGVHLPTPQYLM